MQHTTTRFGRKLPLPSTAEIKHDLRLMAAADALRGASAESTAAEPLTSGQSSLLIGDLAVKHGLSVDRARMLVDRFGIGRRSLDGAAQDLRAWKS